MKKPFRNLVSRCRAEDRAIEALIAIAPTPPTDEEIERFVKEFDEGKHQLTPEDEAALERSRPRFMEMLKQLN